MSADNRRALPIYDATASIVCTIGVGEVQGRIELVERMRQSLVGIARTEHGVLLHFPARSDIEADLRQFTELEKQCCGFWGFDVQVAGDEIRLRWDAPPAADEIVDRLVGWFRGTEPPAALAGLL